MRNLISIGLLAFTLLSGAGCTPDDSIHQAAEQSALRFEEAGVPDMKNDALFIAEMASANALYVQLGELAANNAVSPEVRDLAHQMQQEHRQVVEEITAIAESGQFVLPTALGDAHQRIYNDISGRSGLQFDLAYIKEAVKGHKSLLKRYEDMAKNAVSMDVKQFSSKQVPLARQHLNIAEALERKVGNI